MDNRINFRLPRAEKDRLYAMARQKNIKVSAIVRDAVHQYIKSNGGSAKREKPPAA